MKYHVENNLDLFEFHDADFSFVSFDNNELTLSAKHLNFHMIKLSLRGKIKRKNFKTVLQGEKNEDCSI